jgi:hypothetical protein
VIEEDEWADHTPASERQNPANLQSTAEIAWPAIDDKIKHGWLLSAGRPDRRSIFL